MPSVGTMVSLRSLSSRQLNTQDKGQKVLVFPLSPSLPTPLLGTYLVNLGLVGKRWKGRDPTLLAHFLLISTLGEIQGQNEGARVREDLCGHQ